MIDKYFNCQKNGGLFKRFYFILPLILLALSCKKEETIRGFKKFEIDKYIHNSQTFSTLNKQSEFIFYHRDEKRFKNKKRSNNLIIQTELGGLHNKYDEFNSESFFITDFENKKTDTIAILIDNFNGYYGNSIVIKLYKNQFKTKYSELSDVILPESIKDSISLLKTQLILNKKNFKINDSIYGKVYLKLIYNNENVDVNGYFRTKITERNL